MMENFATVAPTPDEINRLMQVQSEQAVNQLKALVEKMLCEEAIGVQ
jgi:predicted transcriptional regulator